MAASGSSASGFRGAPVSKVLVLSTAALSFLCAWSPATGAALGLRSAGQVLKSGEAWRLFTSLLATDALGSAAVACYLLYRWRLFERQMGSSKYAAFVAASCSVAAGAHVGLLAVPWLGGRGLAGGPLAVVFGLLPLYFSSVPRLDEYARVAGLRLSDKSMPYLLAAALACSDGPRSLGPAAVGLAFGCLYAWRRLPLYRMRFPRALRAFCRSFVLPFIEAPRPLPNAAAAAAAAQQTAGGGARRQAAAGAGPGAARTAADEALPAFEPEESAVAEVVAMGFERGAAVAALRATYGNVEAAVNRLVG